MACEIVKSEMKEVTRKWLKDLCSSGLKVCKLKNTIRLSLYNLKQSGRQWILKNLILHDEPDSS